MAPINSFSFFKYLATLFLFLSTPIPAGAWGSLTGTNTHGYILEQAYQFVNQDPLIEGIGFPTLDQLLANEGCYISGDGRGMGSGPGPDSEGTSNFSNHYFNPQTNKGKAPEAVANWFTTLATGILDRGKDNAKAGAWGGHYLADMSVVYHILGMPLADFTADYAAQTASTPDTYRPGTIITGNRERLSYHMVFTHGENFKAEADLFIAETRLPNKGTYDWFDPWYWNGFSSATLGSSHIEWEVYNVSHNVDASAIGYSSFWKNAAPSFIDPIGEQAKQASEMAIKTAQETFRLRDAYAADPSPALRQAVSNVATLWRASISALSAEPLLEPYALNPSESAGQFSVYALVGNNTEEKAQNVQARLTLLSGAQFVFIEPIKNIGEVSNEKQIISDKWVIQTDDIDQVKLRIEIIGAYEKTPDLQYTRFEDTVSAPPNILSFVGHFGGGPAGVADFVINNKDLMGTLQGSQDSDFAVMGKVSSEGQISGKIHGLLYTPHADEKLAVSGTIAGKIVDQSAQGTWSVSYQYHNRETSKMETVVLSGDWSADKKDLIHNN